MRVVHLHVFTHVTTPLATVTARVIVAGVVIVVLCVSGEFRPARLLIRLHIASAQLTAANHDCTV